jgi:pentatricopeptide repeat protein
MTALPDTANPFDHLMGNDAMAYLQQREAKVLPKVDELMKADPALPFISAYVMAGDLVRADECFDLMVEGKVTWDQAETMVGSYGRLDLRARAYEAGLITEAEAIADLPAAWRGADPDDTDPRFLALWKLAHRANRHSTVRDRKGARIPALRGSGELVRIYRGQDEGAPFGIAWSLSKLTAQKFANGAATRQRDRNGVVYEAKVERKLILGYCVERGEDETIVDPRDLQQVRMVR